MRAQGFQVIKLRKINYNWKYRRLISNDARWNIITNQTKTSDIIKKVYDVKKYDLMVDYKEAIIFVMNYIESNAHILACAYDSLGREEMRRFLYHDFTSIIETLIDNVEKELGLCVKKEFKYFVCNLYTESLAGNLIEWFKNPQNQCKEQVVEYLSIIFRSSLPEILKNAPKY